jgi:RNA recognition motif-containing protein
MQIFVGNLSFASTEADIKKLFERFGSVARVTLLMDKNGRKSRGFCFVDMSDELNARSAIAELDTGEFMGRPLNVMVARPRTVKEPVVEEKRKPRFRPEAKTRYSPRNETFKEEVKFKPRPLAKKPSRFKGGRRSSSYLARTTGNAKPWEKSERPAKPWQKAEGHAKSLEKPRERAKPWSKSSGSAPRSRFKPRTKPKGRF